MASLLPKLKIYKKQKNYMTIIIPLKRKQQYLCESPSEHIVRLVSNYSGDIVCAGIGGDVSAGNAGSGACGGGYNGGAGGSGSVVAVLWWRWYM